MKMKFRKDENDEAGVAWHRNALVGERDEERACKEEWGRFDSIETFTFRRRFLNGGEQPLEDGASCLFGSWPTA